MEFSLARPTGIFLTLLTMWSCSVVSVPVDYTRQRNKLLDMEARERTGGQGYPFTLNGQEQQVDRVLMKDKIDHIEAARVNGIDFPMNFMTCRKAMESTKAFRIIRKMPKGGLLHVHKTAMVSIDWIVKNVTYRPHLYMCVNSAFKTQFRFSQSPPEIADYECDLVSSYRRRHGNAEQFDQTLYKNLSLVREDPEKAYPDINTVWDVFEDYFDAVKGLLTYVPVWKDYLRQSLKEMLEDKIQFVEIRGSLPKLYELNGTQYGREWSVTNTYRPILNEFIRQYPNFIGARLILTAFRGVPRDVMMSKVKAATRMYQSHPDLVAGFDVVGQEDRFNPLSDYVDAFMYPSRLDPPVHLPYFFHAGETVWQDTETDRNLFDALLLNTTRIGHGYAILKHPTLMRLVKTGEIALEVNPISNQVLKLVKDLRNHPGAVLLANDMPVVITSDDPTCWHALPLSHDFYLTFMAMMGEHTGLATLKQLALNSIWYSAMNSREKGEALTKWQNEWDQFITEVVNTPSDRL